MRQAQMCIFIWLLRFNYLASPIHRTNGVCLDSANTLMVSYCAAIHGLYGLHFFNVFFLLLCCLVNAPTSFRINTVAPWNINLIKTDISSGDYCPIFMVTEIKLLFFRKRMERNILLTLYHVSFQSFITLFALHRLVIHVIFSFYW